MYQLSQAARQRVKQNYDWDTIARLTEQLYYSRDSAQPVFATKIHFPLPHPVVSDLGACFAHRKQNLGPVSENWSLNRLPKRERLSADFGLFWASCRISVVKLGGRHAITAYSVSH